MAITITEESKNTALSITNEDKTGDTVTWDEAIMTWDEGNFTWENVGFPITKESKNTALTITNDSKP